MVRSGVGANADMSGKIATWKILLDFIILAIVAFPLLCFMLWAEPYRRGYFPNDTSLMLPYKNETISQGLLAGVGFGFVIIMVIVTEIIRDKRGETDEDRHLFGKRIPDWIWESYMTIGIFTFGAVCQQLTTTIAKYSIGRLRPHFFSICIPRVTTLPENGAYIEDYTCTGEEFFQGLLKDMRLSFPSAHAAFAMYTALFIVLYMQMYWKWRGSKLLRHALQFTIVMAAWYTALTRVVDHMHHWDDITVGLLVGAIVALLVFFYVLKPKKLKRQRVRPLGQDDQYDSRLPRPILY